MSKPSPQNVISDFSKNHLLYGDCLEHLQQMPDEVVDLIYLDPPFNSSANYNMLFGSETGDDTAQVQAFADTWYWQARHNDVYENLLAQGGTIGQAVEALYLLLGKCGMLAYLLFMTERLIQMRRILKKTGSLYLHCDPTASHYLKIVLDAVFGAAMYRNEVVWCYKSRPQPKKSFGKKHDVIFLYTKTDAYKFNWEAVVRELTSNTIAKYKHTDEEGRKFRLQGRGIKASPIQSAKDVPLKWETTHPDLVVRDYLDEKIGAGREDWWDDINIINQSAHERLGYPTQKPLSLLRRVIEASSDKGDIVLDPFCGCGTTIDAAQALGRRWVGMDVSVLAINVVRDRLEDVHGKEVMAHVSITGVPTSLEAAQMLCAENAFEFERWAVGMVHARPNDKQIGDKGSDGIIRFFTKETKRTSKGVVSVKGGTNISPDMVRDLIGTVENMGAVMGVLILIKNPTKGMIEAAAQAGTWEDSLTERKFAKIQIITIAELLKGEQPKMPTPLRMSVKATYNHDMDSQKELM